MWRHWLSPPNVFAGLLVLSLIIAVGLLRRALMQSNWSLADALSEEADITLTDKQGQPILDNGKAVIGSEMRASVSRFIAMFGLIAILILYFGFGIVLARRLVAGQPLPAQEDFGRIENFLFAGVTLFAPYIVNKFSSVFDWLKPPPKP